MKNILFIVPDSTGIRNYLYSDILSFLKGNSNIFIWSSLPDAVFDAVRDFHNAELQYKSLTLPRENILGRWLRETATFARLNWNAKKVSNPTILSYWNYKPQGGLLKTLFNKTNVWIGKLLCRNYRIILLLESTAIKLWSNATVSFYEDELLKNKIDKIFITHQRVAHLMPICLAAKNLGIEVITVIYSWDNLPKARLYVLADKYLVWSSHMKQEMATFYSEIPQEKVIVTGTPQFEFYQKKELIVDRDIFATKYGLDASKKWILYSGGDTLTSPYDQNYLEDLVTALRDNIDIQIIFRRSPADFSDRFETVLKKFEGQIKVLDPVWQIGSTWSSNIPLAVDFEMLANIACHCALAVNVGSTIAHDFTSFNKPTTYVNYDHIVSKEWDIHIVNNYQHFKSMRDLDAVVWVNDKSEWESVIKNVINNPESIANQRQTWFGLINSKGHTPASKSIAELLLA